MAVTSTQRKAMMMLLLLALDLALVAVSPLPILNQTASWTRARRESEELTEEIIEWQIDRLGVRMKWLSAETIAEANALFEDMKAFDKTLSGTYEGGWRLSQHYADLCRNVGALCRAGVWDEVETETKIFSGSQTQEKLGLMQQLRVLAKIEVTGNCLDVARQLANDLAKEVILPGGASDVQRQTRSLQTLHDVSVAFMYGTKQTSMDTFLSLAVKIATELKVNSSMIEFLLKINSLDVIWLLQQAEGHYQKNDIIHLTTASGLLPRLQVRNTFKDGECEWYAEEVFCNGISNVPGVGAMYQFQSAYAYAATRPRTQACRDKAAERAQEGLMSLAVDAATAGMAKPVTQGAKIAYAVVQAVDVYGKVSSAAAALEQFNILPSVSEYLPW